MTVIHLETDAAYDLVNRMKRSASDLEERDLVFSQIVNSLDIHWQSPAQQEYLRDFSKVRREINLLVDQLVQLTAALEKEINQWVAMDQDKLSGSSAGGTTSVIKPITSGSLGDYYETNIITLVKDPQGGFFLISFKGGRVSQIRSLMRGNRPIPAYMGRWLMKMGLQSLINSPIQPDV